MSLPFRVGLKKDLIHGSGYQQEVPWHFSPPGQCWSGLPPPPEGILGANGDCSAAQPDKSLCKKSDNKALPGIPAEKKKQDYLLCMDLADIPLLPG